jgi:hypothetical protein
MARKNIVDFVEDVVVETSDISRNLSMIAREYSTKVSNLDFSIQQIRTFERDSEVANSDWVELDGGLLNRLENNEHYAQANLEYKQIYTVRIFPRDDYDNPFKDSEINLNASQDFVNIYLTVAQGSEIHYHENIKQDFIELINKKKMQNNILIGFRESNLEVKLDEFLKKKNPSLQDDFVLRVGLGVRPKPQIDDELRFVYRESLEKAKQSEGRIDHSKRGFVIAVKSEDLLIQYRKPKDGIPGRDCRGKLIKTPKPNKDNYPDFRIVETDIRKSDTEDTIDFLALKDGNVVLEEGEFRIEDHVQTGELSFRGTGSIDAGRDRDIEIDVSQKDKESDAVGMGVKVTVSTLNVDGNVGENAEINANQVKISGQTHKKSTITANEATIAVHKGKVFAESVNITRLEAGIVEAETVRIRDAVGGIIRAREVYIDNLGNYVKIFSSKKVEIIGIAGAENLIVIDLEGYKDGVNEIEETRKLLTEATQRSEYLQRMMKEELDEVMAMRRAITALNKRVGKFKKHEVEPPQTIQDALKQNEDFIKNYKEMKDEFKEQKEKVDIYQKKFEEIEHAIFDAEIIVRDRWKGYTKIEFKLLNPKKVLEKIVDETSTEATFRLEQVKYEDNEFKIVTEPLDKVKY